MKMNLAVLAKRCDVCHTEVYFWRESTNTDESNQKENLHHGSRKSKNFDQTF